MKQLLLGVALTIFFLGFMLFTNHSNEYTREIEKMKLAVDECAASAALYYDETAFTRGEKIYNATEGIEAIEYFIKEYLHTDASLTPNTTAYWEEQVEYYAYFYDDDLKCDVYKDGSRINRFDFNYGDLYTDPLLGYIKSIGEPIVIVTINAGMKDFIFNLTPKAGIRSSGYEYVTF